MDTKDQRSDLIPPGEGVTADVPVEESLGEFGTASAVRARGYWESVWIRFRKDKFAISGGIWILFVIFMGFVGAPIVAKILGHGPNDLFYGALDPDTLLPVGPWTWVSEAPYSGAVGDYGTTLFVLAWDD